MVSIPSSAGSGLKNPYHPLPYLTKLPLKEVVDCPYGTGLPPHLTSISCIWGFVRARNSFINEKVALAFVMLRFLFLVSLKWGTVFYHQGETVRGARLSHRLSWTLNGVLDCDSSSLVRPSRMMPSLVMPAHRQSVE
jgi:hypothetical protein